MLYCEAGSKEGDLYMAKNQYHDYLRQVPLFADLDKEYPLHPEVKGDPALPERKSFRAALVPLSKLAELREPR